MFNAVVADGDFVEKVTFVGRGASWADRGRRRRLAGWRGADYCFRRPIRSSRTIHAAPLENAEVPITCALWWLTAPA